MELEDLRTTWKSVKPHIDSQISEDVAKGLLTNNSSLNFPGPKRPWQ